jgi:hypothetical protein
MLTTLIGALKTNPLVRAAVLQQIVMALLSLLAMPFDHRQLLGINVWIKPVKFNISIAAVLLTCAIFLGGLKGLDPAKLWIGGSLAIALSIESLLISLQAGRGVRSHMNLATPFDAHVSMLMGLLAVVGTLAVAALLALTFLAVPEWPAAVVWGVRLGLLLFLAGSVEGTLMFQHGGHTIGAVDGGPGLPVLNWSRQHGDLRIAHFFALHALQAFPIFGIVSSRTSWSTSVQVALVFAFSALYSAGVWFLFKLAMHGRPLPLHA